MCAFQQWDWSQSVCFIMIWLLNDSFPVRMKKKTSHSPSPWTPSPVFTWPQQLQIFTVPQAALLKREMEIRWSLRSQFMTHMGVSLHTIVTDSSSRLTYLQLHVGTGMTGFVRRSAATSAMSMCLPLIAWTNSTIAEMAWEMTCLSVELHALTIDYSSVRGLDLGLEWWQCIQQLLTQASTIGEKKPYFP